MQATRKQLVDLETKFWHALVDQDVDTALTLLDEPALMVSAHGAMQFDHQQYRQMAEQGSMVVSSFELDDMNVVFPNDDTAVLTYKVKQAVSQRGSADTVDQEMADSSMWVHKDGRWLCVMHTETPIDAKAH